MKKKTQYKRRVERTKNKHSRAVYRDETIVIRLAKGLSSKEETDHIETLYRRMIDQLMEESRTKKLINPFGSLLEGDERAVIKLSSGKRYTFTLRPGNKLKATKTASGWRITVGPRIRRPQLHRFLWKVLADAEKNRIEHLVESLNTQTLGVGYDKVRFSFASAQWGSCSPRGIIMLNAALLFVQPAVLKYVIIHELAHRRRADHSRIYWMWVENAMPRYRQARDMLCGYRLPSL
jgi:predicted metal-dependent hydrolase